MDSGSGDMQHRAFCAPEIGAPFGRNCSWLFLLKGSTAYFASAVIGVEGING